jgi:hypothetical protein
VKFPIGGKVRERASAGFGATPEPTVIVWMEEDVLMLCKGQSVSALFHASKRLTPERQPLFFRCYFILRKRVNQIMNNTNRVDAKRVAMLGMLAAIAYAVTFVTHFIIPPFFNFLSYDPKDIVIAVDEHKVSNVTDLTRALRNYKAGDTSTIKLIRSGAEMTVEITFDERPQQAEEPDSAQDPSQPNEGSYDEWFDYFRRYFGG